MKYMAGSLPETNLLGEPSTMTAPFTREQSSYEPLPSIWYGGDAELIEKMLDFYPRTPPQRILDCTINRGRFWEGSKRPVIGMDIDPRFGPDVVGDNAKMPFPDEDFD